MREAPDKDSGQAGGLQGTLAEGLLPTEHLGTLRRKAFPELTHWFYE